VCAHVVECLSHRSGRWCVERLGQDQGRGH